MIFSLLKIRKKTAAVLAGTAIGMACLWGIAMWQEMTARELFNLFLGSLLFMLAIAGIALLLAGLWRLLARLLHSTGEDED